MKEPIIMPVLSDTMEAGRLVRWVKQEGDAVKRGEPVAEVETDKAIMDVEAFRDGFLAGPLAPVDTDISVRQVIGYIVDQVGQAEEPSAPAPSPVPQTRSSESPPIPVRESGPISVPAQKPNILSPATSTSGVKASPYARELAGDLGLDLTQIAPGPDGVVHAAQVVAATQQPPAPDLAAGPPFKLEHVSSIRQAVARNMMMTLGTPTFKVTARLAFGPLECIAKEQHLSLTLLLSQACALSVIQHSLFNAVWTPKGLARRERVDIGVAIDLGHGLITPVLRDAGRRPLPELAEDWRILTDKAKRQRLTPEDYTGATFYVSNLGTFSVVTRFDAIVPLGAAAILAVGADQGSGAECTLSCDHRVVFGADAARFLTTLEEHMVEPKNWLD